MHFHSETLPLRPASHSAAERAGSPHATVPRAAVLPDNGAAAARLTQLAAIVNPSAAGAGANRTGLPDTLKAGVERLSGHSLDHVRVHRNSARPAQLNAHAYAQGSDIHLAPGQEKHLSHEAWHVVQQAQGRVRPTFQARGAAINDDAALEREADLMGARAAQSGAASVQRKPRFEGGRVLQRKTPVSATTAGDAPRHFLVDDSQAPEAGQMQHTEFLNELRIHLAAIADGILARIGQTSADCAYLRFWFSYYNDKDAAHIEQSIRKFAPETATAKSAEDCIERVGERVRKSFSTFVVSGKIEDVPSEVPKDLADKEAKAGGGARHQPTVQAVSKQARRIAPGPGQPIQLCCCKCCRRAPTVLENMNVTTAAHHDELTDMGVTIVKAATAMEGTRVTEFTNRRLNQYQEPDPKRLYYTASKGGSATGIQEHGLDPSFGGKGGGSVSAATNVGNFNSAGHVYFFSTKKAAQVYAKTNVDDKETGTYAVIGFVLPPDLVFTPDPEAGVGGGGTTAFRTDQAIPQDCIRETEIVDRRNRNAKASASASSDVVIELGESKHDK